MGRHKLPALVLALIVALSGGFLAISSLLAALIASPAVSAIDRLRAGKDVPHHLIVDAASRSLVAGETFERGRYHSDAALALGRLAAQERKRLLGGTSMLGLVEQALADAPTSPQNWARRAQLQLAAGDARGARGSIDTSLLLGRVVPGLTVPRLRIIHALLRRPGANDTLERSFDEQVRLAARIEPGALAQFADGGTIEGRVQRLLAPDFELYGPYVNALIALRAARARAGATS
jgi:hypothetical protein